MTDAHIGGVSSANIGPNQIFLSKLARFWTFMKAYTLSSPIKPKITRQHSSYWK
jgi:hypothetical protein